MAKLVCLFFGVVFQTVLFTTSDPTATFKPPDGFSVGTEFVAGCTVGGFDPAIDKGYAVGFYLNSADLTENPKQEFNAIGGWGAARESSYQVAFVANNSINPGISVSPGDAKTFPYFEVKINPKTDYAKGKYLCSVRLIDSINDVNDANAVEYRSTEWDAELADAIPTSQFVPPSSFSIGTVFTVTCVLAGFNPSDTLGYDIYYYFNSANETANPEQEYTEIGYWKVINNDGSNGNQPDFVDNPLFVERNLEMQLGVVTSEGEQNSFPNFDVQIDPRNEYARGMYKCSVKLIGDPNEYESNEWDTEYVEEPANLTAEFMPPKSFAIGTGFTAKCAIQGFDPETVFSYVIGFHLNSSDLDANPLGEYIYLGGWNYVSGLDPSQSIFSSSTNGSRVGVSICAGDQNEYLEFEVKIHPQNESAKGIYICEVIVIEDISAISSPLEAQSDKWDTELALNIYEPTLSIQIANNDSKVGTPFTVKCNVQIENGHLEDDFIVKYYFAPTNDSWNYQIAQWNVDPNSNKTTFTTTQIISSLTISRGGTIFPVYEVVIMPNSVQASGAYECSFVDSNYEAREYSSNEKMVLILETDEGNNSGFATKLHFNILWLCISVAFVISC